MEQKKWHISVCISQATSPAQEQPEATGSAPLNFYVRPFNDSQNDLVSKWCQNFSKQCWRTFFNTRTARSFHHPRSTTATDHRLVSPISRQQQKYVTNFLTAAKILLLQTKISLSNNNKNTSSTLTNNFQSPKLTLSISTPQSLPPYFYLPFPITKSFSSHRNRIRR